MRSLLGRSFAHADSLVFVLPALTSFEKKFGEKSLEFDIAQLQHQLRPHPTINAMDTEIAETKVQIRLSTRDPNLQIAEEPTTLLIQTCM